MANFLVSSSVASMMHLPSREDAYFKIEWAARTCYRSHDKITDGSAEELIKRCIKNGHLSILEHEIASFEIITSRAIMAELTRHRLASFSIESTRYCIYKDEIDFIQPWKFVEYQGTNPEAAQLFIKACEDSEKAYFALRERGVPAQHARDVLNMALATNIFMTANFREWRHIIQLRTHHSAHPEIRTLIGHIAEILAENYPAIFGDLVEN